MKYFIMIFCIIIAFSLTTVILIWPEQGVEEKDVLMTVNGHRVTRKDIENSDGHQHSYHLSRGELLNSVAIEQVLLQEAQRREIDKEPAFRRSIKTFYEQSLITLLIDRQQYEVNAAVTEKEIDDFFGNFGKVFEFSTANGQGNPMKLKIDWGESAKTTAKFEDLSLMMQPLLNEMSPGQTRSLFETGNEWFIVRLESVTGTTGTETSISREMVHKIILDYKSQQQLNIWINSLLSKADISIN